MKYSIKIIERIETKVEVSARTVTEALAKAERMYHDDKTNEGTLEGVEFVALLAVNKSVKNITKCAGAV